MIPVPALSAEEANLHHALTLARARPALGRRALSCLQGLRVLYERTGRDGEWARLVADITPDFIDPATGGPLPGREDQWNIITEYRVRLAIAARDWPTATRLQDALHRLGPGPGRHRPGHPRRPAHPGPAQPAPHPRHLPRVPRPHPPVAGGPRLPPPLRGGPRPVPADRRPHRGSQRWPASLGNAYVDVPGLRDLGQAERWYRHSLDHRAEPDRARPGQVPWVTRHRRLRAVPGGPRRRASPNRCSWDTSTQPWPATSRPWT